MDSGSNHLNPLCVVIATTTSYPKWYRGKSRSIKDTDKIRGDLAVEFVRIACKIGYRVVVADWQSPRTFRKQLSSVSGAILIRRRSPKRSPSKRQALLKATKLNGVKVIILSEPEKVSLVQNCIQHIAKPILKGEADIVVPKRDEEMFKKTYPFYQYESEVEGNRTYNEELKSHKLIDVGDNDLDMFFGPRALSNDRKVVSLFMKSYHFSAAHASFPKWYFDAEELSNTNFFPIVAALRKGFKVKSIKVPFKYPNMQKQNEEALDNFFLEKRKAQRIGLIVELLHFVAYLEKYRRIRVKALR